MFVKSVLHYRFQSSAEMPPMSFRDIPKKIKQSLSSVFAGLGHLAHQGSIGLRILISVLGVVFVVVLVLGAYWSHEPDMIPEDGFVVELADKTSAMMQTPLNTTVKGSATTASLIYAANTLLDKSGGYISNDMLPPGVFLDNIPNWEFGVLVQIRDFSEAFREAFSRSQSQSTEDADLIIAEPKFKFDSESWILPSSESVYKEGIEHLDFYHSRLVDTSQNGAQFYARADNLRFWLGTVEKKLGSLSQRLSASVGQRRLNIDLAGDPAASQSTPEAEELLVKTSWFEIDNIFYEARGTTWALVHFMRAVEVDFAEVLERKNALVSLRQIIRELEATQASMFSPIVLNGSGFGVLANHSLVMASYVSRAHAGILDLRELLSQG